MLKDIQRFKTPFRLNEIEHSYGKQVHLSADPYLISLLAQFSRPELTHPLLHHYLRILYTHLLSQAVNYCFPRKEAHWDTRMKPLSPEGTWWGEIVDPDSRAIIVSLARAGIFPSHVCYDELNLFFNPNFIRQDHFYINRKTNEKEEVVGVNVSGSKIGGGQEKSFVFFPDPMGGTGGSLSYCVDHYKNKVEGVAQKYIALHAIITPEYIKRMQKDHPDVEIFAIRLDRGMSSPEILKTIPGTHIDQEKGLNEKQYIIPGAGGIGEVLNNSFV